MAKISIFDDDLTLFLQLRKQVREHIWTFIKDMPAASKLKTELNKSGFEPESAYFIKLVNYGDCDDNSIITLREIATFLVMVDKNGAERIAFAESSRFVREGGFKRNNPIARSFFDDRGLNECDFLKTRIPDDILNLGIPEHLNNVFYIELFEWV